MFLHISCAFPLSVFSPCPWTLVYVLHSLQPVMIHFSFGPKFHWLHIQLLTFLPISHPSFAVLSTWAAQPRGDVALSGDALLPQWQQETVPGALSEASPSACVGRWMAVPPAAVAVGQIVPQTVDVMWLLDWLGSYWEVLIGVGAALAVCFINWLSRLYSFFYF